MPHLEEVECIDPVTRSPLPLKRHEAAIIMRWGGKEAAHEGITSKLSPYRSDPI
jgi:hypothetical protein